MRTLKIKVVDYDWLDSHPEELFLIQILSKYYQIEITDIPDFLIYSSIGLEHRKEKYENCIKIFYTNENVCPDFNECDYAIGFDRISFGDRYLRKGYGVRGSEIGFKKYPSIQEERKADKSLLDRKFCNFIFSNNNSGEGAILREQFCKELSRYKKVDCPGIVLNNMKSNMLLPRFSRHDLESKLDFLKGYKFTIAFENSQSDDYITEKIIHPFIAGSVPIYWGATNIGRDFNENSFINCNLYNNDIKKMVELVKRVDQDDELYLSMIREKPFRSTYKFNEEEEITSFLLHIVENGKKYSKDPRKWGAEGRENSLSYKNRKLFNCSIQWLKLHQNGKSLLDFFMIHNLKNVAIYGAGDLGICLLEELSKGDIKVECFIDRMKKGEINGVPIYGIDKKLIGLDVIVVTAITDFIEIKKNLLQSTDILIISLEEILEKNLQLNCI